MQDLAFLSKELRNYIYALFVRDHYSFNACLSKPAFSTFHFVILVFCLSVFHVILSTMSFEFHLKL